VSWRTALILSFVAVMAAMAVAIGALTLLVSDTEALAFGYAVVLCVAAPVMSLAVSHYYPADRS
jgi:hypothetical protein